MLILCYSPSNEYDIDSVDEQNDDIDIESVMVFNGIFEDEVDDKYFDWNL